MLIFLSTALLSFACTWLVLRYLEHRHIMDVPNKRSSHKTPVPKGAGLAVTTIVIVMIGFWLGTHLAIFAVPLLVVSWLDDLSPVPPIWRLAVQALMVAGGLGAIALSGDVFQGLLPKWLDMAIAGLIWLWFVNAFNFMDGIDAISAQQVTANAGGIVLLSFSPLLFNTFISAGSVGTLLPFALIMAGAAIGFWWWNNPPAKIFLGDVGSVPLGFLLGGLLLELAASGYWLAALILPMYYLLDAGLTLIYRLFRGERIWQAHRIHYYQLAAERWGSHGAVSWSIFAVNLVLIGLAVATYGAFPHGGYALGASVFLVLVLLVVFAGGLKGFLRLEKPKD